MLGTRKKSSERKRPGLFCFVHREFKRPQATVSATAQEPQQRPQEFEEPHHEFPDAFQLVPTRDPHDEIKHHVVRATGTRWQNVKRGGCINGSLCMDRMIAGPATRSRDPLLAEPHRSGRVPGVRRSAWSRRARAARTTAASVRSPGRRHPHRNPRVPRGSARSCR
jgi:hypothetical protein